MTEDNKLKKSERLESLRNTVAVFRYDMDDLLLVMEEQGLSERAKEIVRWGYNMRIRMVNLEIGQIRKQLKLPTYKDITRIRREREKNF